MLTATNITFSAVSCSDFVHQHAGERDERNQYVSPPWIFIYLPPSQKQPSTIQLMSHLQLQRLVQLHCAFLHEHLAIQSFVQLNLISSLQAFGAIGRVLHTGSQAWLSPSSAHPHPSGLGIGCCFFSDVDQIPDW